MTPQIDQFLNKYDVSIATPELLGYLAHLDLDLNFWNEYIKECVEFQDEYGIQTEDITTVNSVFIKKIRKAKLVLFYDDILPDVFKVHNLFLGCSLC